MQRVNNDMKFCSDNSFSVYNRNMLFSSYFREEEISSLIENGNDVNHVDEFGLTPLYVQNDFSIFKSLVNNGANILHEKIIYSEKYYNCSEINKTVKINLLNIHNANKEIFNYLIDLLPCSYVINFLKTKTCNYKLPYETKKIIITKKNVYAIIKKLYTFYYNNEEKEKIFETLLSKRFFILLYSSYLNKNKQLYCKHIYKRTQFFAHVCKAYSREIIDSHDLYTILKTIVSHSDLYIDCSDNNNVPSMNYICMKASDKYSIKCIKFMLNHRYNANNYDRNGDNCLMIYIRNNQPKESLLYSLINTGVSISQSDIELIKKFCKNYDKILTFYENKNGCYGKTGTLK